MSAGKLSSETAAAVEDEGQDEAQSFKQKQERESVEAAPEPGFQPQGEALKSEKSLNRLTEFKSSPSFEAQMSPETPSSPPPSFRTMKKKSMKVEKQFKDRDPSVNLSVDQDVQGEGSDPSVFQHQRELDAVFKLLEENLWTFMKTELQKFQTILSCDYSEASESPRKKEGVRSTEDEERAKRSSDTFLKLALQFLRRMRKDDLADCLWNRSRATECSEKLKSNLRQRFCCVFEGLARAGNPTLLNQIYTELYITEGGAGEVNQEHEIRQIEAESRKQHIEEKRIRQEDIFKASSDAEKPVRTVMTKGVAGIGKTVLTQKFTLDWAQNKTNQDIQFIFPFTFRELNVLKDKKFSLVELVHRFFNESKQAKLCRLEEFQILFIFDGLDECRLPLDFHNNEILTDVTESTSMDVLLTNLILGKLLPSALIWITTRPAAANQIPPACVDVVTDVKGFTDAQKEEYFRKRFMDQKQASRVISHIQSSQSLLVMCHIPVFCWINATVLENVLKTGQGRELPKNLTELYIHFLLVQTKVKQVKCDGGAEADLIWSPESKKMIESLGKLAFDQLQRGNLIFYESDLTGSGIDIRTATVYSGVFTQVFKEERGIYQEKLFCFIHLSVQEFLAALHIHLTFVNSGVNLLDDKKGTQRVSKVFKNKPYPKKLYQTAVDKALQSPNGHLDLVLRILLGLSLPSNQRLLRGLQTQMTNSSQTNQETAEYIKKKIDDSQSAEKSINLFHCLNELNDHSLVEEIQQYLRSGSLCTRKLSSAQWSALVFILLSSKEDLDVFELKKYSASEETLLMMLPVVKASNIALLNDCNLSEKSWEALSSVLSSQACCLRELDLSNNNLEDEGVKALSAGVMSLKSLRLADCDLTRRSCETLSSVLSSKSSGLNCLSLNYNNLQDAGFQQLSNGLKSPYCKLQTVSLAGCNLSEQSCEALVSVLSSPSCCLRSLDMSNNNLGDSGVKLLSVGLENEHCQMETIGLCGCQLSESCCKYLSAVISSQSSKLRELDLSNNNLRDSGVQQLSSGLGSPHCKLETLRLSGCLVTGKGCSYLASALSSNPSHLRELDLSYNHPGLLGKQMLSSDQKLSPWKLTTLRLDHGGEERLKPDVRKYFCELEVDMNSVNRKLRLSDHDSRFSVGEEEQPYPDHPHRFQQCWQLMCRNAVTGRCYWEVEWKGGVLISLSYKGIGRRGNREDCRFGRNDQSWALECSDVFGLSAWHVNRETNIPPLSNSQRIGVFLDFLAGTLSFYCASSETLVHLHTFSTTFTEPVHPGFGLWTGASVSLCSADSSKPTA